MSESSSTHLAAWMPRLIAVWRRLLRRGPRRSEGLEPDEMRMVVRGVQRLSQGLTRDRELVGTTYFDDPDLLGAYLLYFWPRSYAQGAALFGELTATPRSALDLGSGPAPLACAAVDGGAVKVTAADRAPAALRIARELASECHASLTTVTWQHPQALPAGRFDIVTMGHVLNELAPDTSVRVALVESALERLNPRGTLVVLEPALRETSRALLAVRDVLVERGYAIRAPCFFRGSCPALIKPSDWCHAERPWQPPPLVAAIAQRAQLRKESLKMSYLLVAPKGEAWTPAPTDEVFRIVSEALPGKGRRRYIGCGPSGRMGLALQHKHESPANEAFAHLARGDVIRVEGSERSGEGRSIGAAGRVEVIAEAGQPPPKER